jgi:hypothetical protein
LKNERGQISLAALVLLPLLVLIVGGILVLGLALALEAKATTACRVRMAQSQAEAGKALSELTKLNGTAKTLEATRQSALKALKASIIVPNPAARAAALAALKTVELAQSPVRAKQLYWLAKGKQVSSMAPFHARQGIIESLPKNLRAWLRPARIQTQAPRFHLIASSTIHRTPTYSPAPNFQQSQNGVIKWKNTLKVPSERNSISDELSLDNFLPEIEFGCSMTLEPRTGGHWTPQPTEDKLLSNSSSS